MKRRSGDAGVRRGLIAAFATVLLLPGTAAAGEDAGWQHKVHSRLLEDTGAEPIEFLLVLAEQADLGPADTIADRESRVRFVVEQLQKTAARSQERLLAELDSRHLPYRSFWIANAVWVRAGKKDLEDLARRAEVLRVDPNPRVRLETPIATDRDDGTAARWVEWNVSKVRADQVWAMGYTGAGVVIAGQDTGYQWDHPALIGQYRGWNGSTADHSYNWHDAVHVSLGVCGSSSPVPCDDDDHGTHTMGIMVGDDEGTNQIGVSPGARWIGCRSMNATIGTPIWYMACFEWFLAPTDIDGENPDPSQAPHIINNSWTCPPSEGCAYDTLQSVVENTRQAGILVVSSAGNSGSGCSTVDEPPAIYDASLSVGATTSGDYIASFSSRGPVTVDGSQRLKPDVTAPGVSVRSSVRGNGYANMQGTSMAGPHVAGVAALLLDARPDLIGRVDEIETILKSSAVPLYASVPCGGETGGEVPNNTFGYGRIDALAALLGDADSDGTDNLTDCLPVDGSAWAPPTAVTDLRLEADESGTSLTWGEPADPGATEPHYDLLRSTQPDDFQSATCLARDVELAPVLDPDPANDLFCYLVRAVSPCGSTIGPPLGAPPRDDPTCP